MKHKTSSEVPPPGYDKKANVVLGLSLKKEKHKSKDKKKKRRKDSESNGDLPRGELQNCSYGCRVRRFKLVVSFPYSFCNSLNQKPNKKAFACIKRVKTWDFGFCAWAVSDLDKGSKEAQQTGVFKDFSLANGSLPETKATSSEAVHEKFDQRLQAYTSNAEMPSAGVLALSCKGLQTISKQGSQLSLVSVKVACNSNGAAVKQAAPSSRTSSKSEVKLSRESHTQYIPHVEKVWSTLDDQEWLFHHNNLLQSVPRKKLDESPSPVVWAEAVLLPSVGIYAFPYVVPD